MKVYAYLRVSGKGQLNGHGFDRQLDAVKAYCDKHGLEIDKVFKEQVSGTADETDRPEFSLMVTAILRDSVDTIIVESLDRLASFHRFEQLLSRPEPAFHVKITLLLKMCHPFSGNSSVLSLFASICSSSIDPF